MSRRRSALVAAMKRKLVSTLEKLAEETPLERAVAERLLGPDADDPDRIGAMKRVLAREKTLEERTLLARLAVVLEGSDLSDPAVVAELRDFYSLPDDVALELRPSGFNAPGGDA